MEHQIKEHLREFIDEIISEHNHEVGNWIQNSPGSASSEKFDNDKLEATIKRWESKRDELLPENAVSICQNSKMEFNPYRPAGQRFVPAVVTIQQAPAEIEQSGGGAKANAS